MVHGDGFWRLEQLSNAQLLESLGGVLRTQRRALAELVAHLGEVEDRRLHLEATYSSMFAYCVARLGMSEDEACRRIELARLSRRFPALFAELASGQITLSVALVLKPVLSPSNHLELLSAARGKNIRQARELVAERSPKADVPSNIRKLPERQPLLTCHPAADGESASSSVAHAPLLAMVVPTQVPPLSALDLPATPTPSQAPPNAVSMPARPMVVPSLAPPTTTPSAAAVESESSSPARRTGSPPASRSCIEPLSARRYRIQFTADAELKQKLELARDLLRHAHPDGDFGPIVSRALELLIEDLLRRRFGAGARRKVSRAVPASAAHEPVSNAGTGSNSSSPSRAADTPAPVAGRVRSPRAVGSAAPTTRRAHIPRAARRAVLERDGLGCSWVDAQGIRCGSQAWLELDHRQPAGKDGTSEPDNLRLRCRAHNHLAAEHEYGREHIERRSKRRQNTEHPSPT